MGTRSSLLALAQTRAVVAALKNGYPEIVFKLVRIRTLGDWQQTLPLAQIGGKGVFIKEIEEALLARKIDFAVHSLKDLPTELPDGLSVAAITRRLDSSDCLISAGRFTIESLPSGALVGTSSLRRQAQLLYLRPDLNVIPLRGNLDTRLKKLLRGEFQAIVLASAGVERLSAHSKKIFSKLHNARIPQAQMLPAVGQGSLAIEARTEDLGLLRLLKVLHHAPSAWASKAERSFLAALEGGCQVPAGISTQVRGVKIHLQAMIAAPTGQPCLRARSSGLKENAQTLGAALAKRLLSSGGKKILEQIRRRG